MEALWFSRGPPRGRHDANANHVAPLFGPLRPAGLFGRLAVCPPPGRPAVWPVVVCFLACPPRKVLQQLAYNVGGTAVENYAEVAIWSRSSGDD